MTIKSRAIIIEFDSDVDGVENNQAAFKVSALEKVHLYDDTNLQRVYYNVIRTNRPRGDLIREIFDIKEKWDDGSQYINTNYFSNSLTLQLASQ